MRARVLLSAFLTIGLAAPAFALPTAGRQAATKRAAAEKSMPELDAHQVRSIYHAVNQQRLDGLRARSRFFAKITVQRDWNGEHIVHHDANVTAFLDMSDPSHPRYDREAVDEDEGMAKIPEAKRAHILVVPNVPREHIGKSVSGVITLDDINTTKQVLESAHQVAKDLGIKNPRIYFNTADRLTVGYLHVHIVGERGSKPYPKLAP